MSAGRASHLGRTPPAGLRGLLQSLLNPRTADWFKEKEGSWKHTMPQFCSLLYSGAKGRKSHQQGCLTEA